jgi:hypothetical protein
MIDGDSLSLQGLAHSIVVTSISAWAIAAMRVSKVQAAAFRSKAGEELLDRIEIGTVGGQMTQFGAGAFDGLLDAGHFRHTRGSSRHPWGRQARRERRLRRRAELRRTSSSSDVRTAPRRGGVHRAGSGCHVSARTRFVDEDQALWVQFGLTRMPNFDGPRRCPAAVGVNRRRERVARPRAKPESRHPMTADHRRS